MNRRRTSISCTLGCARRAVLSLLRRARLGAIQAAAARTTRPPARSTTSRAAPTSGSRPPTSSSPARQLGIPGSTDRRQARPRADRPAFPALQLQLRPARSHKFRFQYIPIKYDADGDADARTSSSTASATALGLPVELDARLEGVPLRLRVRLHRQEPRLRRLHPRGQVHRRAACTLATPDRRASSRTRAAPIPALGGIGRVYVVPNISITGEVTGFKMPDSIDEPLQRALRRHRHLRHGELHQQHRRARAATDRSTSAISIKTDTGAFTLKGMYFGVVVRY